MLIVACILLLASAIWGAFQGLMRQLGSIAGVVVGVMLCRLFGDPAASMLATIMGQPEPAESDTIAACILLFLLGYVLCLLLGALLRKTLSAIKLGWVDVIGGAAVKAGLCLLLLSIAFAIYASFADVSVSSQPQPVQWAASLAPRMMGVM